MTKPVNVQWLKERVTDLEAEVERLQAATKRAAEIVHNLVCHEGSVEECTRYGCEQNMAHIREGEVKYQPRAGKEAEVERLRRDQQDWRKGVELIASALGYEGKDLACVAIAEAALTLRTSLAAKEEALRRLQWLLPDRKQDQLWTEELAKAFGDLINGALSTPTPAGAHEISFAAFDTDDVADADRVAHEKDR